MNKEERDFQKTLAYHQIGATVAASVGAIIISMGIATLIFGTSLAVEQLDAKDDSQKDLENFRKITQENGWLLIKMGSALLIGGPAYFVFWIIRSGKTTKISKLSKRRILFDEMYDGKEIELEKRGYNAYSVKKLRLDGEPLQYDYSVLKYVEENKMTLITEDSENHGGCKENGLPCIKLGQNPSIDEIIKELETF